MSNNVDEIYKIIIVGDTCVGKSTFFQLLQKNKYFQNMSTVGVDYATLYYNIEGKQIKVIVWDTAGQERFNSIIRSYFRNACGIILMYDLNNILTLNNLEKWLNLIEYENVCKHKHPILLIGNKKDKKTTWGNADIDLTRLTYKIENLIYIEMSCTNKHDLFNLEDIFTTFIKSIMKNVDTRNCSGVKILNMNHITENNCSKNNNRNKNDNRNKNGDNKETFCCNIS